MDTTIYYFSATGNSLTVARQIASNLGNTTLVKISPDSDPVPAMGTMRIGLVFPVIIFGLPLIVRRFIERLQAPSNAYIFAVATSGGMPCATLKEAESLFSERGLILAAGFGVSMINNCTVIAGAMPQHKQLAKINQARQKVEKICRMIKNNARHIDGGIPVLNWYLSGKLRAKAILKIPSIGRSFYADEKCNGCGICEKVCPMKNIALHEKKPVWQERCEQCYACLQWCPKESIQVTGKKTEGRRRYRHPEVQIADIIGSKT